MAHIDPRELKPDKNGKRVKAYLVRWVDAAHKERAKSFSRMADAKTFKVEIERALLRGTYIDPRSGDITFRQFGQRWLVDRVDHRASTSAKAERHLRVHAYPLIGDLRMGAARHEDLQRMVSALVRGGKLAASTIGAIMSTVRAVFAAAETVGLIIVNPCAKLHLPELVAAEVLIPSNGQLGDIVSACASRWYRRLVLVAAGTGLRPGELRGLTEDRVDWLRRTVKVDRQLVDVVDGQPVFGPPKTAASYRTVPVAQSVIDVMAEQIADRGTGPDGLIFTGRGKTPITRRALSKAMARVLDPLGWPDGTGLHLFRHYYASLLIHHGLSVKVVQRRLGHATGQETLDTYGHLWPDTEEDSRTAVEGVLAPIIGAASTSPSQVRESVKSPSLNTSKLSQIERQSESSAQVAGGATP